MKIFVGADYKGHQKKIKLVQFLIEKSYDVSKQGSKSTLNGFDFNDAAIEVSSSILKHPGARGILICDSAHGMTMQANRFKGIRAANCCSVKSARLAREHDDANVLCLSAGLMSFRKMKKVTLAFLTTDFEPLERRVRRIKRLDEGEDND